LGFEKLQRSVTHDSLRYINIITYLLTYNNTRSMQYETKTHKIHIEKHK